MPPLPPARDLVRSEVRRLLEESQAYQALAPEEQTRLANHMVKVGEYLAEGQADAVDTLKNRLAQKPGQVGAEFKAGAIREGVNAFRDMVQTVDFPKFVSGLVHGVFQAVVDASIQQMRAYGELLAGVSATVDDFANDNITDSQARDYVANKFPEHTDVDTSGDTARLRPKAGADDADFTKHFGQEAADIDLSDDDSEQKLVGVAKTKMAHERQQMLATMVLMGINRIVVTNGQINAKVVFDMRASDQASRHARAEMSDKTAEHASISGFMSSIFGGGEAGYSHETTVSSSVDDQSESKASVKAQLSGDVKLQFKSETFPLERMVDVLGMQEISAKAQAPRGGNRPAKPAATAPASTGGTR